MNKSILLLLLLLSLFQPVWSQTYKMKKEMTEEEKQKLVTVLADYFKPSPAVSYTLSSFDMYPSIDSISDRKIYDDQYKATLEELLKNDPGNPLHLNDMANYYNYIGQVSLAESYFRWAYESMDLKYFDQDSAQFYSCRGVMRINLKDEKAVEDLDRALQINPNDSLALAFYPLFLLQRGEYARVKEICEKSLQGDNLFPEYSYLFLGLTEVYEAYVNYMMQIEKNPDLKAKYAKQDYKQLVKFTLTDKYTPKYPANQKVKNARAMLDILALMFKVAFAEETDGDTPKFLVYTKADKLKLSSLEAWLQQSEAQKTVNSFSVYKSLGFIYFMQDELDKAVSAFQHAIEIFPEQKSQEYFNTSECYSGVLYVYSIRGNYVAMENTLRKKLESAGSKSVGDYCALAQCYFYYDKDNAKALEWALKARDADMNDVSALLLLMHLSFFGDDPNLVAMYMNEANQHLTNAEEARKFGILIGVYSLIVSDPDRAYLYFTETEKAMKPVPCEECEAYIKEYINVESRTMVK